MENKHLKYLVGALAVLIVFSSSLFTLDQRQNALIIQFGEPVNFYDEPGLKFKIPFIQDVFFFDKRIQNLHADTTEVISADQKVMRVDAFTKYKIVDALKFYQSVKDEHGFKARLAPILESSLRQVLGSLPFVVSLTPERAIVMSKIKDIVHREAESFGVAVIDVRIMRADLPEKSRDAVYDRMKSERVAEAKIIRAEGAEKAQEIRAIAEKDKLIIVAEAKKKGQILRGHGEGDAIKAFASAFGKDAEFYGFYRSMEAYKKAFGENNSKLVLSPDSEFMRYFKSKK